MPLVFIYHRCSERQISCTFEACEMCWILAVLQSIFINTALLCETSEESQKLSDFSASRNRGTSLGVKPFFMGQGREPLILGRRVNLHRFSRKSFSVSSLFGRVCCHSLSPLHAGGGQFLPKKRGYPLRSQLRAHEALKMQINLYA